MSKSKCLVSGIIAAFLMLGTGNLLLADGTGTPTKAEIKAAKKRAAAKVAAGKRGRNTAAPAMPSGVAPLPDAGAGYDKSGTIREFKNELGQTVYEVSASQFDISAPLSEMAVAAAPGQATESEGPENPQLPAWRMVHSNIPDPVVQVAPGSIESLAAPGFPPAAPSTGFNFLGVGISGGTPSDSNGTVGNSQFVETVNTRYQVWNLNYGTHVATSALGPSNISTLWAGFGGPCQTQNAGDPVVLYDKLADRWLISQFTSTASSSTYYQCVAVSTTASATGTYARWAFAVPSSRFGDYPKIGLWTDAYYMSAHAFTAASGGTYVAAIFAAMDRVKMLAGNAGATWQVILDATEGGQLPADLDGFAPPPTNAPGIFLSHHAAGMFIYRFKVDWVTPANTVKTLQANVPVAAATDACLSATTVGTCIPQLSTTRLLDSLSGRLMYRAAYRNFVDHESVVVNHTVDPSVTGLVVGVRWYDFRLSGTPDAVCTSYPCTYQQGTVADVANGRNRWMGSLAMDGAENILLGYSTSGKIANSDNQSIRYTGRAKTDTLGQMTATETIIATGIRSNTGSTRWGDYTSMAVDPIDDCTFWYTNQYIPTTTASNWGTQIASITYPAGTGSGQCSPLTCANATRPASAPTIGSASASGPNQLTVTWTGISPTPGAYAVERAVGACGSEGLYQPLAGVPAAASSFVDNNVIGGYTYSYRVIAAADAGGKCQSLVVSGCASATATGTCTLKPVFTGASNGTSNNNSTCGVNVNWTAATSSCPLTPNIRYNIFRGTTPDFVPSAGNRIASCVTGPSSYLDTFNLSSGVTYYYLVRAEDDSTGNGGECGGGNEESNAVVVGGTAYGVGSQASPGTWTDAGGDGTAFLQLNVAGTGDTADQAWRFVSTASDAGANHTTGGAYAYRNAGPTSAATYNTSSCTEMQTPSLTVGATTTNLQYWERHQLEYHWDGIAIEYQRNGGAWTDVPAPSNSTGVGCAASDTTTNWETLSCTGATPANACGYAATKNVIDGPLGTGTTCTNWTTNATVSSYAHRCHQITGLTSGDTIKFRWRFSSDSAADYAGFYLDDIAVTSVSLPNTCAPNPCGNQPNGTACSDGNACTIGDTCQSQVCTPGTPVTCTASDQCHDAGTCNPGTGVCSNPNKTNGTSCTDGNACTQTDTCQSGVCTGSNPVTCTPSDQCHVAGTCDTGTGLCSNPTKSDGSSCSDGNACTQTDTCQSGSCTGGNPVVCTPSDQCHVAGTCDTGTGLCSNPTKSDGSICNDGDACTQTDACTGGVCIGSNPVICNDSNPCTDDACNPATGLCLFVANDGNACTDNNVCTNDACSGGSCVHTPSGACSATGSVFYYRTNVNPATEPTAKPVSQVGIDANGDGAADGTTDLTGAYSIPNLAGHVTLGPVAKYGAGGASDTSGAISSLDASLIARTVVGNAAMSPNQRLAGDVTGNGTLGALDASEVARYSVGLVDHFDVAVATLSDWKFVRCDAYAYPGDPGCGAAIYDYNPIGAGVTGQNFYAVLYGEVTGNWQPATGFAASSSTRGTSLEEQGAVKADQLAAERFRRNPPEQVVRAAGTPPAELTLHGWTPLRAGERRQLTIDVRNADGILGLDLSLKYDPSRIAIVSVDPIGIGAGLNVAHGELDGTHRISAYGVLPLTGNGSVLTVTIEGVKDAGRQLPLTMTGTANEGGIPLRTGTQKASAPSVSR